MNLINQRRMTTDYSNTCQRKGEGIIVSSNNVDERSVDSADFL